MSLGRDIAAALPGFRAEAESLMTDTVRIKRGTGLGLPDPVTGDVVPTFDVVYEGKSRLKLWSSASRDVESSHQLYAIQQPRLDVPVETPSGALGSTAAVRSGDVFEILSSVEDAGLVGVSGVVGGFFPQTYATARRFTVEVAS